MPNQKKKAQTEFLTVRVRKKNPWFYLNGTNK